MTSCILISYLKNRPPFEKKNDSCDKLKSSFTICQLTCASLLEESRTVGDNMEKCVAWELSSLLCSTFHRVRDQPEGSVQLTAAGSPSRAIRDGKRRGQWKQRWHWELDRDIRRDKGYHLAFLFSFHHFGWCLTWVQREWDDLKKQIQMLGRSRIMFLVEAIFKLHWRFKKRWQFSFDSLLSYLLCSLILEQVIGQHLHCYRGVHWLQILSRILSLSVVTFAFLAFYDFLLKEKGNPQRTSRGHLTSIILDWIPQTATASQ